MADRTVHAKLIDQIEVVRYNRAGKWYIEYLDGRWYLDGRPWQRRIGAWWLPRYHSIGYWLEESSQETA